MSSPTVQAMHKVAIHTDSELMIKVARYDCLTNRAAKGKLSVAKQRELVTLSEFLHREEAVLQNKIISTGAYLEIAYMDNTDQLDFYLLRLRLKLIDA